MGHRSERGIQNRKGAAEGSFSVEHTWRNEQLKNSERCHEDEVRLLGIGIVDV